MSPQIPDESPTPRADVAYETIRTLILDCDIAPGGTVSERGLASQLDIGIASTRAALLRLASEGLVTAMPRVGYRVQPITLRSVETFFEAWLVVGPEFTRLAVSRLSDAQREEIRLLPPITAESTHRDLIERSEALYEILARAADNPVLNDIYRRLQRDMRRLFALTFRTSGLLAHRLRAVTELPLHGDAAASADATRAMIEQVRRHVMAVVLRDSSLADVALTFDSLSPRP